MAKSTGARTIDIYCPYTGKSHARQNIQLDHVIPLSLGGSNGLQVHSHHQSNNEDGSRIEQALGRETVIRAILNKNSTKGHRGNHQPLKLKRAYKYQDVMSFLKANPTIEMISVLENTNKQRFPELERFDLTLMGGQLTARSQRDGTVLDHATAIATGWCYAMQANHEMRLKFVCKVVLGAGYALYGRNFLHAIEVEKFRSILNKEQRLSHIAQPDEVAETGASNFNFLYADPMLPGIHDYPGFDEINRLAEICKFTKIVFQPYDNGFNVIVAIYGQLIGAVYVNLHTTDGLSEQFLTDGEAVIMDRERAARLSIDSMMQLQC